MLKVHFTRDVFVAGGTPSVTYNPRQGQQIERKVTQYLSESGKALTIHGASKSGKTSLVERLLPDSKAIWLQGQDIESVDDFWGQLGMRLGVAASRTQSQGQEQSSETAWDVSAGVPKLAGGGWHRSDGEKESSSLATSGPVHVPDGVRERLSEKGMPIVIDDFHFIPDTAKRGISRAIKTIVRSSPLILVAVPSEAFELVRTEPEMSMRVWSLPIPPWTEEELAEIAVEGFRLLNLLDVGGGVGRRLAKLSYGSPFIMQQLCHDLVRWELGVEETVPNPVTLSLPADLDRFLGESADRSAPPLFPRLLAGPATKGTGRKAIRLRTEALSTDIYGAVLAAIRNLVPPMQHLERNVHAEVQRITLDVVAAPRVNNALRQMNDIAFERRGVSDPVLRLRDDMLFIQDAMLAFYLRHGSWSPAK